MTGSLTGAVKGAMWGAVSAGVAFGIGQGLEHAGGIFTKGVSAGKALIKASAHGLSRAIISMAQGGTFKSGFASGFSASFFSPGTTMGGDGAGGFTLRTTISGIVGGTASEIGGGKFSNGAVSGAFVHMFNAEMGGKNATGKLIKSMPRMNSDFEYKMFDRYWNAEGDYMLSESEFSDILSRALATDVNENSISVSLYYDSKYDFAIGVATLYYSSNNDTLNFYDVYDFDPRPYWGNSDSRGAFSEFATRSVNREGRIYGASGFTISY